MIVRTAEEARAWRAQLEKVLPTVPDKDASGCVDLYPTLKQGGRLIRAGNSKLKNWDVYGSAYHWYERSPRSGDSNNFCMVDSGGDASYSNVTLYPCVTFSFCV